MSTCPPSGATEPDDTAGLVVISTFTVDPAAQDALAQVLSDTSERVLRHQRGFIASSVQTSLDGTRVVNHAHWSSEEALAAMQHDPAARAHMTWVRTVATVEPVRYRLASTHRA